MVVMASDTRIRIPDAGLEIQIERAPRWSPRFRSSAAAVDLRAARWTRRAAATRETALAQAAPGGLGSLLGPGVVHDSDRTLEVARPVLAGLIAALEADDRTAAAGAAGRLIGLGPGLTPSGDDVLIGIEAALHALAHPSAGFLASAVGDVEARTTEVAATLLRHAAAGEFAEPLHALVATLLGSDDETIPAAIERALAWGATSGADCLVGVLIGLDVAAGVRGALA
jgi:hypothetical protein